MLYTGREVGKANDFDRTNEFLHTTVGSIITRLSSFFGHEFGPINDLFCPQDCNGLVVFLIAVQVSLFDSPTVKLLV
jgi:hypothetical protein